MRQIHTSVVVALLLTSEPGAGAQASKDWSRISTAGAGTTAPTEEVSRYEALARVIYCSDFIVDISFDGDSYPYAASARSGFWGCYFGDGWPDAPFPDAGLYAGLINSVLSAGVADEGFALASGQGAAVVSRAICSSWVALHQAAWMALTDAERTALQGVEPSWPLNYATCS